MSIVVLGMDHVSCPVDCGFWEVATRFGRWIMEVVVSIVVLGMDHVSCPVDCGFWEVATRFGRWIM